VYKKRHYCPTHINKCNWIKKDGTQCNNSKIKDFRSIEDWSIYTYIYKRYLDIVNYSDNYCILHWQLKYYLEETINFKKAIKNKETHNYYTIDNYTYCVNIKSHINRNVNKFLYDGHPYYNFWQNIYPKYMNIDDIYELE